MRTSGFISLCSLLFVIQPGHAVDLSSTAEQAQLLELYTSEGCSSCPPADRWLSSLLDSPDLWCRVVPVAFHVDYWDYIGWTDRFASKAFSDRQRAYARAGDISSVYTPGFVLAGNEWRGWFDGRSQPPAEEQTASVNLQLGYADAQGSLSVYAAPGTYVAYVAWLGFDQRSEVRRGENRGKTLRHDFVVLHLQEVPLAAAGDALRGEFSAPGQLPASHRYAVAAWVARAGSLQPLQSIGGWLDTDDRLLAREGC